MTPVDFALASAGRAYATVSRGGRAARGARLVVVGLILLTVLPVIVIGLTPTPMEISLEDLRQGHYATRTSWLRLEGELEPSDVTTGDYEAYVLRDPSDPELAVTVLATVPLPTGHVEVTGQPLGGVRAPGTFEAFYAEVPAEPARHDPWLLIALPALIAVVLLVGERVGYPVVRKEKARRSAAAAPLAPDEELSVRWNGRVGGEEVPLGIARAASVSVSGDRDVATLVIADERGVRSLPVRRRTPKASGRVCRLSGCQPGLEVHATGADIVFEFDSASDRDRLAVSIS